jgi:hypothetical protein
MGMSPTRPTRGTHEGANQPDDRSRRRFLKAGSVLGLAVALDPWKVSEALAAEKEKAMAQTSAAPTSAPTATKGIRPFEFSFPDADLADLSRRIKATKWPEREPVNDASQGVQLGTAQKLATYWATDYDWRKGEARLKALPHFITEIDGLDIHFIHVRSKQQNALPVIITHGWPGSIVEQLKIIEPLTNPTAHGGSASDAFAW